MTKDGEVEKVTINGGDDYKLGSWYEPDAEIVIFYHTFPAKESDEPAKQTDEPAKETVDTSDQILTIDNSEELLTVLTTLDPGSEVIQQFIKDYNGRTIQFDGFCWDWSNHVTTSPFSGKETVYKTLYTTNFYYGDIENLESSTGPIFRAEGVSIPNYIPSLDRQNIRVTATVSGYNDKLQFFMLSSVKFEMR